MKLVACGELEAGSDAGATLQYLVEELAIFVTQIISQSVARPKRAER